MRVNEHNLDSLREIIRELQTENEKLKQEIKDRMLEAPRSESVILIATGQKIGEGLNFPRLDTLMLASPVKFEGRLIQYVGRLNRIMKERRM